MNHDVDDLKATLVIARAFLDVLGYSPRPRRSKRSRRAWANTRDGDDDGLSKLFHELEGPVGIFKVLDKIVTVRD
jgi:hypothetical protein